MTNHKCYEVDSGCPNLNSIGWSDEKKKNVDDMLQKIQSYYKHDDADPKEVLVIFHTTEVDGNTSDFIYDIENTSVYFGKRIIDAKSYVLEHLKNIVGVEAPYDKVRVCIWHNHLINGSDFSIPDMKIFWSFSSPVVSESFLDVSSVRRVALSDAIIKGMTQGDKRQFYNAYEVHLRALHTDAMFRLEMDRLNDTFQKQLYPYALRKMSDPNHKDLNFERIDRDYQDQFRILEVKYTKAIHENFLFHDFAKRERFDNDGEQNNH